MSKATLLTIALKNKESFKFSMLVPEMTFPFEPFTATNGIEIKSASAIQITDKIIFVRGGGDSKIPTAVANKVISDTVCAKLKQALKEYASKTTNEVAHVELDLAAFDGDAEKLTFVMLEYKDMLVFSNLTIPARLRGKSQYVTANGTRFISASHPSFDLSNMTIHLCGEDRTKDASFFAMPLAKREDFLAGLEEYARRSGSSLNIKQLTTSLTRLLAADNYILRSILRIRKLT